MKTLQCGCCGSRTKGKQHWNHDTGYGLCPRCVQYLIDSDKLNELKGYGTPGVNYAAPLSLGCSPGMLVGWKTRGTDEGWDTWHIGTLKEFDNGTAIVSEINELDERHTIAVRCV